MLFVFWWFSALGIPPLVRVNGPPSSLLLNLCQNLRIPKQEIFLPKQKKKTAPQINKKKTKNIVTTHLLSQLDGVPAPSGQQHPIPSPDARRRDASLFVRRAWPDRDHGRFWERARRRGGREEDSRRRFLLRSPPREWEGGREWEGWTYGFGFETLHKDAVEEGNEGFDRFEGSLGSLERDQSLTGTQRKAKQRSIP
jgi:hypothetical protein